MRWTSEIMTLVEGPSRKTTERGMEICEIIGEEADSNGNHQYISITYLEKRAQLVPDTLKPGDRFIAEGTVRGKKGSKFGSYITLYGNTFMLLCKAEEVVSESKANLRRGEVPTQPRPARPEPRKEVADDAGTEEPYIADDDLPF